MFGLATIAIDGRSVPAIRVGGHYWRVDGGGEHRWRSIRQILDDWPEAFGRLDELAEAIAAGTVAATATIAAGKANVLTPVQYPDKLLAVGANYRGHLTEMGLRAEKWSSMPFFLRPPQTSLVGPGATVIKPRTTNEFDWEIELAIVIGRTMKDVPVHEALSGVAGFSVGFDMSCRDLIPTDPPLYVDLMRGKAQDTMAPLGPVVVPRQFIRDPQNLSLKLWVNDVLTQDGNTDDMLYSIPEMVAEISRYMTLVPGDILFTGSPSGSAKATTGRFLEAGDRLRGEIEAIGTLDVEIVAA
jgi:2-keto-4-pentenoate hydratase/2-oxohepta-3-ene-1,7-dioic acid hydratase in catechol pathway